MAYNKNSWQDGDIITAEKLNHMEDGIEAAGGLTNDVKTALLQIAEKVAYIDEHGQDYYDDLYDALYPSASLVSISAVYTQSGTVYPTTSLSALKDDLVVTAYYDDTSSEAVPAADYMLSGALTVGTSVITASYNGKTTTFTVTVTAAPTLSSISAVYTQSGTVYDTDSLDSLKSDLVVTATYSDSSTATVPSADYTLSGTLTVGTSTITVSYEGKTTTFNVTVISDGYSLLYSLDSSDMMVTGDLYDRLVAGTGGYYAAGDTRVSYVQFDLQIDRNKYYKVVIEPSDLEVELVRYAIGTADLVANGENISSINSGWQSSEFEVFNSIVTSAKRYELLRVAVRKSNDATIALSDLSGIQIRESADKADGNMANMLWIDGYITGSGTAGNWPNPNSSHSQGEMYTAYPIPVTEGHTYSFANSDSSWTSSWGAYQFYNSTSDTYSARSTMSFSNKTASITVPAGYDYVVLSSRNMANYHTTATFTDTTA